MNFRHNNIIGKIFDVKIKYMQVDAFKNAHNMQITLSNISNFIDIASYYNNMQYISEQYKQANSTSQRVQHKIKIVVKLALNYIIVDKNVVFQGPSLFDGCMIFIQKKKVSVMSSKYHHNI